MKFDDEMLHSGIATFVGSDYVLMDDVKEYEVAVVGVPVDMGASYRLGAKMGPRAIREHSMWKKIDGLECYDYDNRKYVTTNDLKICDVGDVRVCNGNLMLTQERLIKAVSKIRETTFPVILGGDHSITYGGFVGVKNTFKDKRIGLLHFDAHNDTEPNADNLSEINHCNQFTTLLNKEYVRGTDMVTIGVRGIVNKTWHDFAISKGVTHITANEFNNQEPGQVLQFLKDKFKDCDGIYVTFDMDSLEAAYSEGTGTPKYNGLKIMKTLEVLRGLKDFKVYAFDIVELCPDQDASGITSFIAWEVLYNFLALGYNKEKNNETK
ncbi:MAG: agmatinase family protein [Clostridia bacterium]|nr:agmatinase family protein [Clostridia bacterium]